MRTKPTTRTSTARTSNPDTGRTAPTTLRTRADKAAASVKAAAQDVGRGATRLGRRALRTVRRLVTNVETRLAATPSKQTPAKASPRREGGMSARRDPARPPARRRTP
jgi:hypothetical protein